MRSKMAYKTGPTLYVNIQGHKNFHLIRFAWLQKIGQSSAPKNATAAIKVLLKLGSQTFCSQRVSPINRNSTGSSATKSFPTEDRLISIPKLKLLLIKSLLDLLHSQIFFLQTSCSPYSCVRW